MGCDQNHENARFRRGPVCHPEPPVRPRPPVEGPPCHGLLWLRKTVQPYLDGLLSADDRLVREALVCGYLTAQVVESPLTGKIVLRCPRRDGGGFVQGMSLRFGGGRGRCKRVNDCFRFLSGFAFIIHGHRKLSLCLERPRIKLIPATGPFNPAKPQLIEVASRRFAARDIERG
jgi:hypothetical protein